MRSVSGRRSAVAAGQERQCPVHVRTGALPPFPGQHLTDDMKELMEYPFAEPIALQVDPLYRDLQSRGPIKVQLPYGEPCWLATRYEDCRIVYGDRRFGRERGLDHDWPGMWSGERAKDPSLLLNMDPPKQSRVRRLTSGAFSPARVLQLSGRIQAPGRPAVRRDGRRRAGRGLCNPLLVAAATFGHRRHSRGEGE